MKWFHRKTQKQTTRNEPMASAKTESQSSDTIKSEPQELLLLLLRPSISKIFESPSDSLPMDADVIMTSFGMYSAKGMNKHALERLPILCVSESCSVGYTFPMRLDLQLCLHQLATNSKSPIDYPPGLFTNRDVIVVTEGLYTVRLFHNDVKDALKTLEHGTDELLASKIIYASTTIDEGTITNLRRLEATAKHLLTLVTPEPTTPPKLPPEIVSGWQHDFLEPIFKHARETRQ